MPVRLHACTHFPDKFGFPVQPYVFYFHSSIFTTFVTLKGHYVRLFALFLRFYSSALRIYIQRVWAFTELELGFST